MMELEATRNLESVDAHLERDRRHALNAFTLYAEQ
jgi:hypothetical protein